MESHQPGASRGWFRENEKGSSVAFDDLKERLIEIDENLARVGPSIIDEGEQREERQQVAQALGLANPRGGNQTAKLADSPKAYTDQAATANNESARSIQRKVQIARDIDPSSEQTFHGRILPIPPPGRLPKLRIRDLRRKTRRHRSG